MLVKYVSIHLNFYNQNTLKNIPTQHTFIDKFLTITLNKKVRKQLYQQFSRYSNLNSFSLNKDTQTSTTSGS